MLNRRQRKALAREIAGAATDKPAAIGSSRVHSLAKSAEPYATLAAVVIAVWSVWFTIKSGNEMDTYLDRLNQSVERAGSQLDELPVSIARFDSSVGKMTAGIDEQRVVVSSSLDTLTTQLKYFHDRLITYRNELDKIVAASDRQLELLEKRQVLLERELGRKSDPRLAFTTIETDSGTWQISPIVENRGDAPSEFFNFFFDLPEEIGFVGKRYAVSSPKPGVLHVSFSLNEPIGFYGVSDSALTIAPSSAKFELTTPPKSGRLSVNYTVVSQHGTHRDRQIIAP